MKKRLLLLPFFLLLPFYGMAQTLAYADSLTKARIAELNKLKPIFQQKKTGEDSLFAAVQSDVYFVSRITGTNNISTVPGAAKIYYGNYPSNAEQAFSSAKPGDVIGPFVSGNVVGIYKIRSHEIAEDCVMVRHLLVTYRDAQRASPAISRSRRQAKELADSLCKVIVSGETQMTDLILPFTDDPGSKMGNLGNYGMFTRESGFVKAFKDAGFNNPVGATVVVETEFGFHVIQVLDKKLNQKITKACPLERVIDPELEYLAQQYNSVIFPVFPGGITALKKYLTDSLRYPANAKTQHKEACVEMMFKVGKDGKIYDVAEVRNGREQDAEFINEAKRLIAAMPPWKAAVYKDKEIDWILKMKVRFVLN